MLVREAQRFQVVVSFPFRQEVLLQERTLMVVSWFLPCDATRDEMEGASDQSQAKTKARAEDPPAFRPERVQAAGKWTHPFPFTAAGSPQIRAIARTGSGTQASLTRSVIDRQPTRRPHCPQAWDPITFGPCNPLGRTALSQRFDPVNTEQSNHWERSCQKCDKLPNDPTTQ